jgi:hypothetical protein
MEEIVEEHSQLETFMKENGGEDPCNKNPLEVIETC